MLRVAIDAGPLHGPRTGIGNAVAWSSDALRLDDRLQLLPYVTSTRARLAPTTQWPERRLPIPAALALRLWARSSRPKLDRLLGTPDVVHGTNYVVPPTRCPRLVTVYDCWFLEHPDDAHSDVRLAAGALRRAVGDGAHVVCSSAATAQRAGRLLDTDRIHTIHLGPPPTASGAAPAGAAQDSALPFDIETTRFVLALGTLERRKNLPTLVAAFARVAADIADVALVIAGRDGDDSDAVTAAIDRLDTSAAQRVHRIGAVSHDRKAQLLRNASVLAYPSLDEGFGFPLLEAQMAQTPVVASSAGSIPEVAGSGALLSSPRDADALAANLHSVLSSEGTRARLVTHGIANVERFSWEAHAASLADLYHHLAERLA